MPEQIPVPARSAPDASAPMAPSDRAPKLTSDTNSGIDSRRGRTALGPLTVSAPADTSSSGGRRGLGGQGFVATFRRGRDVATET